MTDTDAGSDNDAEDSAPFTFPDLHLRTDPDIDEALLATLVRGNAAFALDLLAALRDRAPGENLFFSPYSVSTALAMTYAGVRGKTAQEMADALHYTLAPTDLHFAFGALEVELACRNEDGQAVANTCGGADDDDGSAFEFTTANTPWGQEDYRFQDAYVDLFEAYYEGGLQLVDFSESPEAARQQINEWVEAQTNARIKELLPAGSIDELTRLVVTTAGSFVARWKYQFDEEDTEPRLFTGLDGTATEVAMMHRSLVVPYVEVDGHQLIELPYANDDSSMVILLPAEGKFEPFEAAFDVDRLATMLGVTSQLEVELTMPKFKIESAFNLVAPLQTFGMERAFEPGADFSGMVGEGELSIDAISHGSFLQVDEFGTEAAAATAAVLSQLGPLDLEHVELTVDRPFLFYIRDRPTDTLLFVGRVVDADALQRD